MSISAHLIQLVSLLVRLSFVLTVSVSSAFHHPMNLALYQTTRQHGTWQRPFLRLNRQRRRSKRPYRASALPSKKWIFTDESLRPYSSWACGDVQTVGVVSTQPMTLRHGRELKEQGAISGQLRAAPDDSSRG